MLNLIHSICCHFVEYYFYEKINMLDSENNEEIFIVIICSLSNIFIEPLLKFLQFTSNFFFGFIFQKHLFETLF